MGLSRDPLLPAFPGWNSDGSVAAAPPSAYARPQLALDMLATCVADIQGLWAVMFVYCTESAATGGLGMSTSVAGSIMLVQGAISTCFGPLVGKLYDIFPGSTRAIFAISPLAVILITWSMLAYGNSKEFAVTALLLQGFAGAGYPPGMCSIGVKMVGSKNFPQRASRNETWKHIGAIITAGILPMLLVSEGTWHGFFTGIIYISVASFIVLSLIWNSDLQFSANETAEDLGEENHLLSEARATSVVVPFREVLFRREVFLFVLSYSMFHFANAAMLPQLGYKLDVIYLRTNATLAGLALDGTNGIAMATIISQVVMVPVAGVCGFLACKSWAGSKRLLLVALLCIFLRGAIFATSEDAVCLLLAEILDGVGAGIGGVASILLMSDLTEGTGQFGSMQGMVGFCLGLGSAGSHGVAGLLTDTRGIGFSMWFLSASAALAALLILPVPDRRIEDIQKAGTSPRKDAYTNPAYDA